MWLVSIEPDKINHDRRTFEFDQPDTLTMLVELMGGRRGGPPARPSGHAGSKRNFHSTSPAFGQYSAAGLP
jgi:hypothetical protein